MVRWERASPPILLALTVLIGAIQLLAFPVTSTAITVQAIVESVVLIVVVVGLFLIPSARELTDLSTGEADAVYPPVVLGLGLFAIRAVTDVLDEFLAYPDPFLTVLEDGAMIAGIGLLLSGLIRWAALREHQERLLRDQRDRLDQQNDHLEAFAGVVSHDLRNPLSVAMGRLDLARETGDAGHLDAVETALDRMDAIISDVLALARVGADAIEPTAVSLRAVSERAWETVETGTADLRFDLEGDPTVTADETYLQQLFENVFRNAVEHGSTSGHAKRDDTVEHGSPGDRTPSDDAVDHAGPDVVVRVGTTPDGFYVEDTGPGIPPDERETVFEVGYSTRDEGTGLGLSIVEGIARAHGWSVTATESAEGGARFEVGTDPPADPTG